MPDEITLVNRPGMPYLADSLAIDSTRLAAFFQNRGWFDCQIKITLRKHAGDIEIDYEALKGRLYKLSFNPVFASESDTIQSIVLAAIDQFENQSAITGNIENLANEVLGIYADHGFPYCEVKPQDFQKTPEGILKIKLYINPGPKVEIFKIEFSGRKNLEQKFLESYISLGIPCLYSAHKLETVRWRLTRAGFLKDVGDFQLRYSNSPEKGIAFLPIKEVSPVAIDGAIGYSSKNKSIYGQVMGALTNILGKGRQFVVNWTKKDKASRKLRLAYTEPLAFGQPIRIGLAAYQDDRDSLYIESGGELGISLMASENLNYGVSLGASQITPEPYGRSLLPSKRRLWLAAGLSADTRDNQVNPRWGDFLKLEARFINEKAREDTIFPGVSINFRTARLDYQKSIPTGRNQSIFIGMSGRGDFSTNGSIDRQFPVGGFGSLRGYSQDFFYAIRTAIISLEYRLLTGREGRAYIFTDMAAFQRGLVFNNKTEFKSGFGIGILAPVQTGLATVELAVPSDEGVSAIKLHFGIKAGF
jgi:outer membrane protein assembly factor BamA